MSLLRERRTQLPYRRLQQTFDPVVLKAHTSEVAERFGLGPERPQLCLTSRPGATDPLSDGAGSLLGRGHESEFTVFNHEFADTIFAHIQSAVPYRLGRVRLMYLAPRSCYSFHQDGEPRLHISITTNDQCALLVETGPNNFTKLHIPADGSLWWVDTMRFHNAVNGSSEPRIHWVAAIVNSVDETHPNTL